MNQSDEMMSAGHEHSHWWPGASGNQALGPMGGANLQAYSDDSGGWFPACRERYLAKRSGCKARDVKEAAREQTAVTALTKSVMTLRLQVLYIMIAVMAIACGGSPAVAPTPTAELLPQATSSASPAATGDLAPVPGDFDIARVRLMDAADLPEGIPLPVPYGGEIDESFAAFAGEVLAVEYDVRFFQTAVAFYATWIQMQSLQASPLMSFSESAAGWEVIINGAPVRVEISISPDGAKTQLAIYWD